MAYFSRNGFTPAYGSTTKSKSIGYRERAGESVTVKDVKYASPNGLESDKNLDEFTVKERELEKVMEYAKCLIRNLLHLFEHEHVGRKSLMEFTATWSQFVRWRSFKRTELQFPHHSFMLELEKKLNILAKVHQQSDLIEISLSPELSNQLNDSLDDMKYLRDIKFNEIWFDRN